jgi:glutamine cyclotransferase
MVSISMNVHLSLSRFFLLTVAAGICAAWASAAPMADAVPFSGDISVPTAAAFAEPPALPQETLALGYEIVQTYPHDPAAFSQGLFFQDGFLYESTGRRGQSSLRKVDLESGSVLQEVSLPTSLFGEGIAPFGDKIYQLTWQSGLGLIYDASSFESAGQFRYAGEGWGFTQDGRYLIMSNGSSSLYFLDPVSTRQVGRLQVYQGDQPVTQLNELEYIKGFIYANVWHGNAILKISPNSGRVVAWIDLSDLVAQQDVSDPEAVLNGIAYDAELDRIFVTGKLWPNLYEIRVTGEE